MPSSIVFKGFVHDIAVGKFAQLYELSRLQKKGILLVLKRLQVALPVA